MFNCYIVTSETDMGRRSTHTPEQLTQLILDAAQAIIEEQGLAGLSAREIARRISYSPGTIYNMFENLDDVILNVEARVLESLEQRLAGVLRDGVNRETVNKLALSYLAFTHERPKLWNLLFEHHMAAGSELPAWYQQKLGVLLASVEQALAPHFAPEDTQGRQRAARVLWAGVHGITSLSTADKLSIVSSDAAQIMVDDLVRTYLRGVHSEAARMAS